MFRVIESPEEGKSFDGISLFVNKKPVKAELCRVSALPFNTPWPGHQRPIEQSEEAGFIITEICFMLSHPRDCFPNRKFRR